jgi:hypothetical protein
MERELTGRNGFIYGVTRQRISRACFPSFFSLIEHSVHIFHVISDQDAISWASTTRSLKYLLRGSLLQT